MAKHDETRDLERTPSTDFESESLAPPQYTETYDHSYDASHDPETVVDGAEGPYHIRGENVFTYHRINSTDSTPR